ncbi:MAG: ATP-binding protein [Patescibacteria group bacterium]
MEVLEILARGHFDELLGTDEGPQIEFKEQAYNVGSPKGRRDLIADVAAFANGRGGAIVLGVRAPPDPTSRRERADQITGIDASSVNEQSCLDLVRAHVRPLVRDVEIHHYDGMFGGEDKHLVAINIEAQAEHDHPFIVDRIAQATVDADLPHAVGWPSRAGDTTSWEHPARIQQLIAAGLRWNTDPPSAAGGAVAAEEEARTQIELVIEQEDWDGWSVYVVQAVPDSSDKALPDFFGEFRTVARRWRGTRDGGFNLKLEWNPLEPVGNRLGALGNRSALVVGRTGIVTAAGQGSPDFLGWAQQRRTAPDNLDHIVVNPYVLVEFTVEVLRFAYECIGPLLGNPSWQVRVRMLHMLNRIPLRMRETVVAEPPFDHQIHPALLNELELPMAGTGDALRDAFSLLAEVYGQGFGMGESTIPFVTDRAIDFSKF